MKSLTYLKGFDPKFPEEYGRKIWKHEHYSNIVVRKAEDVPFGKTWHGYDHAECIHWNIIAVINETNYDVLVSSYLANHAEEVWCPANKAVMMDEEGIHADYANWTVPFKKMQKSLPKNAITILPVSFM